MFDPEKNKKAIDDLNKEIGEMLDAYEAAYKALYKAIGWLPGDILRSTIRRIQDVVEDECEVEGQFDGVPIYIIYGLKNEES